MITGPGHEAHGEEVEQGETLWLYMNANGRPFMKVPLARVLREFIDKKYSAEEALEDSVVLGERAFLKLKIGKVLSAELDRA